MLELLENKIKQLNDEIEQYNNVIAKISRSIDKNYQQKIVCEENIIKINGQIEAFQATVNYMKVKGESEKKEEKKSEQDSGI